MPSLQREQAGAGDKVEVVFLRGSGQREDKKEKGREKGRRGKSGRYVRYLCLTHKLKRNVMTYMIFKPRNENTHPQ